ncbi:MAG: HEPN domain-containing protein [Campylobacterales bacterium]
MRVKDWGKKSGYFWLPENPNHKIPGTLSIADGGKIELEVVGLFNEGIEEALNDNDDLTRIVGHIEKDGLITLDDCFYTNKNISLTGGITKSLVHVNRVFSGVAYEKNEYISFHSVSFSVECMDEWIGISGIKVMTNLENKTSLISYSPPDSLLYPLNNGMNLEISFAYTIPLGLQKTTEAKVTQKTYFRLSSDTLRPLADFTAIIYRLTNFLCFALDTTVSIKGLTAISNEIVRDIGNDKTLPVQISIYYQSNPFSEKEPDVNWYDMIFSFATIKDNAGEIFNKWIDAYDSIAPTLGLYFSTKIGAYKHLEGEFLALVQGLETYHRRISNETLMSNKEYSNLVDSIMENCPKENSEWLSGRLRYGNEISLSSRIKKTIEPFGKYIGSNSCRKKLIKKIVDTRNYLTHYDEALKEKAASGGELWILCIKMEAIFQLHFLKVIGFTEEEIDSVAKNSHPLKRKLDEK